MLSMVRENVEVVRGDTWVFYIDLVEDDTNLCFDGSDWVGKITIKEKIKDTNNEAKVINSMIPLQESKLYTLKKILSTYCDITNSIKFSKTMLNLNNVYNFKSNNKDVYNEFIMLISNLLVYELIINRSNHIAFIKAV